MKRSPLAILFLTLFIDLLGFGLVLPLIPVYITHYGGESWVGGFLMASFSAMQFIFTPIWGRASDRYGRRPLILLSLLGSAAAFLAFGLAHSLPVLFVARVSAGILTAASLPTSQAYVADVTPPDKRASGMAVLGAAFGLGFAFGPAIGGILSRYSVFGLPSLATPALFAALLALCNFLLAFFLLPESHTDRAAAKGGRGLGDVFGDMHRALKQPHLRNPILVFSFLTFAFAAVESSFSWLTLYRFKEPIREIAIQNYARANPSALWTAATSAVQQDFIEKAQAAATSQIFLIVGITILFTQGAVMGGLARRVGEHRLVWFGLATLTVTMIGIAIAPSLLLIKILSACIAIGNGVASPSLSALIMQFAGKEDRGLISGAQQGLSSLSRIFSPPINNYLVGKNTAIPFLGSAILMAISFSLSLRLRAIPKDPNAANDISLAH